MLLKLLVTATPLLTPLDRAGGSSLQQSLYQIPPFYDLKAEDCCALVRSPVWSLSVPESDTISVGLALPGFLKGKYRGWEEGPSLWTPPRSPCPPPGRSFPAGLQPSSGQGGRAVPCPIGLTGFPPARLLGTCSRSQAGPVGIEPNRFAASS